ncbi:SGNH/GDSL hydrolase family protein [Frigoribacterium salinisoli]
MSTRTTLAFLSGVGTGLALVGAAGVGVRRFVVQRNAAAATLNGLLPVHSAWWRQRFDKQGSLLYVALGDSTAQGIGATNPGRSYVGRLAGRIRSATHGSVRVVNLSVSGATTWLCRKDQLPKLAKIDREPDVVTVGIGANDIIDFEPERFERNLRHIYSALPSHAIVGDVPAMFLPDREKKIAVANEIVHRVAAEHSLTVAPVYDTTRRRGFLRTWRNSAGDLFHPNDRGYRVWASAFEPAVAARVARFAADRASADHTASAADSHAADATASATKQVADQARAAGPQHAA